MSVSITTGVPSAQVGRGGRERQARRQSEIEGDTGRKIEESKERRAENKENIKGHII